MDAALSTDVGALVHMGWRVQSQTETTAALETRSPFNWFVFALAILLFFGFGGLLYIAYWMIVSREHLFLSVRDGQVAASGDTWLVEQQQADAAAARRLSVEIHRRGFWDVMWPSIVAMILMIVLWIVVIRIAIAVFR